MQDYCSRIQTFTSVHQIEPCMPRALAALDGQEVLCEDEISLVEIQLGELTS